MGRQSDPGSRCRRAWPDYAALAHLDTHAEQAAADAVAASEAVSPAEELSVAGLSRQIDVSQPAHSGVFTRYSDPWQNTLNVLTGDTATTYREPVYTPTYGGYGTSSSPQTGWGPGGTVDIP